MKSISLLTASSILLVSSLALAGGKAKSAKVKAPARTQLTKLGLQLDLPPSDCTVVERDADHAAVSCTKLPTLDIAVDTKPVDLKTALAKETNARAKDFASEEMADGWAFSYHYTSGSGNVSYFAFARRDIAGKSFSIKATAKTPADIAAAMTSFKALHQ